MRTYRFDDKEVLLLYCFDMMIELGGLDWMPENIVRDEFRHMWE